MTQTTQARGRIGERWVHRIGYGAMQLVDGAAEAGVQVLRRAVERGVDHIDTAQFYGAGTVNGLIRRALSPFPDDLTIVTKIGAERVEGANPPLIAAQRPEQLRTAVQDNLRTLGIERLDVVNLRRMDRRPGIVAAGDQLVDLDSQLDELLRLRFEGKIGSIGLSHVDAAQLAAALPAGIVSVQNSYSLIDRTDEPVFELAREHDLAWVPYFPLGSAFPNRPKVTDHPTVRAIGAAHSATPAQIGLAWLLAQAPTTLLIPGTRSVDHLTENLSAATVVLSAADMVALDALAGTADPSAN